MKKEEITNTIAVETNAIQSILNIYLGVEDLESQARIANYCNNFLSDFGVDIAGHPGDIDKVDE